MVQEMALNSNNPYNCNASHESKDPFALHKVKVTYGIPKCAVLIIVHANYKQRMFDIDHATTYM